MNIQGIRDYDEIYQRLKISAFEVFGTGSHPYGGLTNNWKDDTTMCGFYNIDETYDNQLTISRIDFDNEIISGTFEMRVVNENCDTLIITHGRFDLSS